MLFIPDRLTLWLAWIAVATAAFTAFPLGPMGLLGWMGAAGPLLHRILPHVGAKRMSVVGIGAIALVAFVSSNLAWYEIVIPPMSFLFGLLLAPVPITGYEDPGIETFSANSEHLFQLALAREVGRARRHERPLTLVSATCDQGGDLKALEAAIASQIHIYAQIFQIEDRLMLIVPELDRDGYRALEARILQAAEARQLHSVALGVASFPEGECTASGLVAVAGTDRRFFTLGRDSGKPGRTAESADRFGDGLPFS